MAKTLFQMKVSKFLSLMGRERTELEITDQQGLVSIHGLYGLGHEHPLRKYVCPTSYPREAKFSVYDFLKSLYATVTTSYARKQSSPNWEYIIPIFRMSQEGNFEKYFEGFPGIDAVEVIVKPIIKMVTKDMYVTIYISAKLSIRVMPRSKNTYQAFYSLLEKGFIDNDDKRDENWIELSLSEVPLTEITQETLEVYRKILVKEEDRPLSCPPNVVMLSYLGADAHDVFLGRNALNEYIDEIVDNEGALELFTQE